MFIRGKKPHYFPPSADCLQFLLVLCSLSIPVEIRLHVICIFVPSPWKMTFTFCSDQIPAGSGSARQGSRVGSRQFSVIFLICSVPWQALALFLRWSWTFTFLSVFFPYRPVKLAKNGTESYFNLEDFLFSNQSFLLRSSRATEWEEFILLQKWTVQETSHNVMWIEADFPGVKANLTSFFTLRQLT